jgi:hypothetical protein
VVLHDGGDLARDPVAASDADKGAIDVRHQAHMARDDGMLVGDVGFDPGVLGDAARLRVHVASLRVGVHDVRVVWRRDRVAVVFLDVNADALGPGVGGRMARSLRAVLHGDRVVTKRDASRAKAEPAHTRVRAVVGASTNADPRHRGDGCAGRRSVRGGERYEHEQK